MQREECERAGVVTVQGRPGGNSGKGAGAVGTGHWEEACSTMGTQRQ